VQVPPKAGALGRTERRLEVVATADLAASEGPVLRVSGVTGQGLDELRAELSKRLGAGAATAVASASARHVRALELLEEALARARLASSVSTLEVVAGELGVAEAALAEVTGADASTELLDAIFARFCIGK
jgi:tRNA modification GTPase